MASRQSSRPRERAIALVITLLLLAVITFMAVAFLVITRSEHGNVATATDQTTAKNAAYTALTRAMTELMAPIMATTNPYNYGILVATNYVSAGGFNPNPPALNSPTNVNYDHTVSGGALTVPQYLQNLANLVYSPRPPVFIVTNVQSAASNEFRYYRDENRNGHFDPNGLQPVISPDPTKPYYNATTLATMATPIAGNTLSNVQTGDPEWIGQLQLPQFAHSASNQFIARFTYMAVPVGMTLDVNTMHNDSKFPRQNGMGINDGFFRNQGVLTSELNLAAFFSDLNTNLWPVNTGPSAYGFPIYNYFPDTVNPNTGVAFQDAQSLLYYRYNGSVKSLANVSVLYGNPGNNAFQNPFDVYSEGPLMTNTFWLPPGTANPNPTYVTRKDPWQGAQNPNHFSSPQDFFNEAKTALNVPSGNYTFTRRLQMAGTNLSTYDRSTYTRLLSQLGTDSDTDLGDKMNLNYVNVDASGRVVPSLVTNFVPWQPTNFFMNAAIRLLADAGYSVGNALGATNLLVTNFVRINGNSVLVTNLHIPIYPTNLYTPAVHRLLQVAANLYDSTTNRLDYGVTTFPYLPTVFRPIFLDTRSKGGSVNPVFITGYSEFTTLETTLLMNFNTKFHDLSDPADLAPVANRDMVYGIPMVVGAKKGLPNFNAFAEHTAVQVTRKLQFRRPAGSSTLPVNMTNQMYMLGVSNVFGIEAWNSYNTTTFTNGYFPRNLRLIVAPNLTVTVTNETGKLLVNSSNSPASTVGSVSISANTWQTFNTAFPKNSFQIPVNTNVIFLQTSTYSKGGDNFIPVTGNFEQISPSFYLPHWWLTMKSRMWVAIVDTSGGQPRIVDFANLSDQTTESITDDLTQGGQCDTAYNPSGLNGSMWCTNRSTNPTDTSVPTYGILNQIETSLGLQPAMGQADWNSAVNEFPPGMDKTAAIDFFRYQYDLGAIYTHPPNTVFYKTNTFAAPYQPFRTIYLVNNWQANDPLVHYTVGDMQDLIRTNLVYDNLVPIPTASLGAVNARYEPWGFSRTTSTSPGIGKWEIGAKDPVAARTGSSDSFDFVTNKFANPGWMGRVHRGTPWQTVYFKSPVITSPTTGAPVTNTAIPFVNWQKWTGNGQLQTNYGQVSTSLIPLYIPGTLTGVYSDAFLSQPTNDWRLLDVFSTAFSDTATKGQLSVNQPGLAAWSAVLSGMVALTNGLDVNGNPALLPMVVQPAGYYDPNNTNTWPAIVQIVNALNAARSNSPNQVFTHLGDILAVPNLTVGSPFINSTVQPASGSYTLNDAAYERIPQQILGLLKVENSPRYVIYSWGQALKPAPHSVYTGGGAFFGLVTNYQIMAEVATRAVVRFDGAPAYQNGAPTMITNLHPVIESFTVLPPD